MEQRYSRTAVSRRWTAEQPFHADGRRGKAEERRRNSPTANSRFTQMDSQQPFHADGRRGKAEERRRNSRTALSRRWTANSRFTQMNAEGRQRNAEGTAVSRRLTQEVQPFAELEISSRLGNGHGKFRAVSS